MPNVRTRGAAWLLACVAAVAGFAPRPASTPAAPTITSVGKFVYVNGVDTQVVGTPGLFKLSDPGSTVTGYYYSIFDTDPVIFVPAGNDGTATLAITPDNEHLLHLTVQAIDGKNGPRSPSTTFDIQVGAVANIATLAWWKFNAGHGTNAADSTGFGKTARLSGDAKQNCLKAAAPDGYRCSLLIGGSGGEALVTPSLLPIVGIDFSFTVSAWVNVTKCGFSCVALSEDASSASQFALKFQRACRARGKSGPCWKFSMPIGDLSGDRITSARSRPGTAKVGTWTQLTGVFAFDRQMVLLYVNGVLAGQAPAELWSGPPAGLVRIGNLIPGGTAHDWTGRISDVCLIFNALQGADITLLYKGDSAHPYDGCAAVDASYP
jgi:hypothetical protein